MKKNWLLILSLMIMCISCKPRPVSHPGVTFGYINGGGTTFALPVITRINAGGFSFIDASPSPDGGICISGSAAPPSTCIGASPCTKAFIAKYDRDGKELWFNIVDDKQPSIAFAAAAMPDGGCALTGEIEYIYDHPPKDSDPTMMYFDILVARYAKNGRLVFMRKFDFSGIHSTPGGHAITALPGNNMIVGAATTLTKRGNNCPVIMALSPNGDITNRRLDCGKSPIEYWNIQPLLSGGFITHIFRDGYNLKHQYYCDNFTNKLDSNFNTIYRGKSPFGPGLCITAISAYGKYLYASGFDSDKQNTSFIIKSDLSFKQIWKQILPEGFEHSATRDGGVAIAGIRISPNGTSTPYATKISPSGKTEWTRNLDPNKFGPVIELFEKSSGGGYIILTEHASKPKNNTDSYDESYSNENKPEFWIISLSKTGGGPPSIFAGGAPLKQ